MGGFAIAVSAVQSVVSSRMIVLTGCAVRGSWRCGEGQLARAGKFVLAWRILLGAASEGTGSTHLERRVHRLSMRM